MSYQILLTIDVEDWFQVENFKQYIPFSSWSSYDLRVERNTHRLLDLLDSTSFKFQVSSFNIRATFFILGWIAERLPHLVREIHTRGHEIASHGYNHRLCTECSTEELKIDLIDSKKLLEDIIGERIYGYRAPSFSINNDILKIIEECGYLYDSSFNSFGMHGRYGHLDLSKNGARGIAIQFPKEVSGEAAFHKIVKRFYFYELPISNLNFTTHKSKSNHQSSIINHQSLILPWGGGGYFRLIPFPIFRLGVQSILKKENAYLFYMHSWEIDPEQPKVKEASIFYKFRHYVNLNKSYLKLSKFLECFNECSSLTCHQYIKKISG